MPHEPDARPDAPLKVVGIIGGSTDVATAEYYRLLNIGVNARLGGHHTAEVIINSMNFAMSAHYVNNALWEEGGLYLRGKAKGLERAGAEFLLCVSNTWHRAAHTFMDGVEIPLLHIVDPTGEAIREAGLSKVALLGTKPVMATRFLRDEFERRYGLEIMRPEENEQELINRIIFDELSKAVFKEQSRSAYLDIVDRLVGAGAEGVILGCTEIPLLIQQEHRPDVPMFDTLRLHVAAAVAIAVGDRPLPGLR